LGIGVFSPPLDARGNSVRGIQVCDSLSRSLDLHLFNSPHASQSVIRLRFSGSEVNSSKLRAAEESRLLRESGQAIRVYQLQGILVFSTCEVVVREVLDSSSGLEFLVLDLKHVLDLDESACRLLYQLGAKLALQGKTMLFARTARLTKLRRYMKAKHGDRFVSDYRAFDDNDVALEWCEDQWLSARLAKRTDSESVAIESYELFRGLTSEEIRVIAGIVEQRSYRRNEVIVEIGAEAREVFFLNRGSAIVTLKLAGGEQKVLGVFSAGTSFGELGMLDQAPRSAMVMAATDVEAHLLNRDDFDALGKTHPRIKITLLTNMALGIARLLRKATREISVFDY